MSGITGLSSSEHEVIVLTAKPQVRMAANIHNRFFFIGMLFILVMIFRDSLNYSFRIQQTSIGLISSLFDSLKD